MFSNLSIPFTNSRRQHEQQASSRNKLGELTVTLHRASGLAAADSSGFSDPYVKLRVKYREGSGQDSSTPQDLLDEQTSTVKYRTLEPEWNETFTLPVYDPSAYLHVEVYDKNSIKAGVFLGQFEVGMNRCFRSDDVRPLAVDEAYTLTSGDSKGNGHIVVSGNVRVSLYYIPEGSKMTLSMMEAREMDTIDELSLSVSGVYSSERKSTLFKSSDNGLCQWDDTLLFSCPKTVPRQSKVNIEVKERSVILGVVNMSSLGHVELELADVIQEKNRTSGVSYNQSRWLEVIGDSNEVIGEVFVNVSIPADVQLEQVEWQDSHPQEDAASVPDKKMEMLNEITGDKAFSSQTIEMINGMTAEEAGLYIEQLPPSEAASVLNMLEADRVVEVFENMPRFKEDAQVMKQMRTGIVSRILGRRSSVNVTTIMTHMSTQMASDVIAGLNVNKAAEVLAIMPSSTAIEIIGYMDVEKSAAFLAKTDDERAVEMVEGLKSHQAAEICDNLDREKASIVLRGVSAKKRATIVAFMTETPIEVEETSINGDEAADSDGDDVVPELRSSSIRRPTPLVPMVPLGSDDHREAMLEGLRSPLESARSGLESYRSQIESARSMPERTSFYDTEEESIAEQAYDQSDDDERSEMDLSEEEDAHTSTGMERLGMRALNMTGEDEDEEDDMNGSLLSRSKGPQGSGRPGSIIRFQVEDAGPPPPRATCNASNTRTQLNKLKQKSKILIGSSPNRPPVWERLAMSKDSRNARQVEASSRAHTPPSLKTAKYEPGKWRAEPGSSSDRGGGETNSRQGGKKVHRSNFRFTQGWVGTVWERLHKPKCPRSPEEVAGKQKPHPKGFGSSAQTERLSPSHGRRGDISPSTSSHSRTTHSKSPVRSPSKSPAQRTTSPGRPLGFGTSQNLGRLEPPKAEDLPPAGEIVLPGKDRRYSVKAVFSTSRSPKLQPTSPAQTSPSPTNLESDERRLQSEKEEAKLRNLCETNPTKGANELGKASLTVASRVLEAITPQQVIVLLRHIQSASAAAVVKNLYAFIKWLEQMPPRACLGHLQSLPIQVRGSVLSRMHSNNLAQIVQLLRDEDVGEMLGALEPRCVAVLMQVQSIKASVHLMQKLEASQIALVVREMNPALAIPILKAMESKFKLTGYLKFVLRDVEAKVKRGQYAHPKGYTPRPGISSPRASASMSSPRGSPVNSPRCSRNSIYSRVMV